MKYEMTSRKEALILRILNSDNPDKLIAVLSEAIEMMQQGKSDEEIKAHFGLV